MNGITCDMCSKELLVDDGVRYLAEIQVYAAYDPLEISSADLRQDFKGKISELVSRLSSVNEEDAQSSVYRALSFDLCPRCQKEYIKNPLPARKTS